MRKKLSQWAKENNYTYNGAYLLFKRGGIPGAFSLPSGTILIDEPETKDVDPVTIVYGRVSSSENKDNLDSQIERVSLFCLANGWTIDEIVRDIGSGLNDERRGIEKILSQPDPVRLVVEHKDRLTRFGFNFLRAAIERSGGEIVVINSVEDGEEDIVQDFVSVITSMCARIYGKRRSARKTEQLIRELQNEDNPIQ